MEGHVYNNIQFNISGFYDMNSSLETLNETFKNVCDSNSSRWKLEDPVCSIIHSSFPLLVIVALVLAVITLWTIFGNILVLCALYKFPNLRSISNCLIGNLAVSDLLLAITVLPLSTVHDLLGFWVFGETMCTLWLCIDVLNCTASIWGLCTIAVDRYTATIYPVWYFERRSPVRALIYIIFVWLFSLIVSFAPFIGWRDMISNLYRYNPKINRYECVLFQTGGYVVYSAMGSFVIPIFLMTFLYIRIFIVLKKRTRILKPRHKKKHCNIDNDNETSCINPQTASTCTTQIDLQSPIVMKDKSTQISPFPKRPLRKSSDDHKSKGNNLNNEKDLKTNSSTMLLTVSNDVKGSAEQQTQAGPKTKQPVSSMNGKKKHIEPSRSTDDNDENGIVMDDSSGDTVSYKEENICCSGCACKSCSPMFNCLIIKRSNKNNNNQRRDSEGQKSLKIKKGSSLRKRAIQLRNKSMTGIKSKYELREQRATKRMAIVMACFCFCWIPFLFMYLIRSFCDNCELDIHIQAAIIWLGYANSGINPILYTLFNDDFRRAFEIILGIRRSKHKKRRH
ncbi:octopamine receptor 2-like [Mytilus edulis]|uniref:octopamine receptor 2-like n=1 Tax=Mytilus edulis TaxID=6550 RepID=UPI0039EFFBDF